MANRKPQITKENLGKIENLFAEKFQENDNSYSILIRNNKINSSISVEIFPDDNDNFLVSVYTNNTHLQLQSCSNVIVSEMLEEILFISETSSAISGMIISKQGDCALYANVDKKSLRSDFSDLDSEKLLAAIALSISDTIN